MEDVSIIRYIAWCVASLPGTLRDQQGKGGRGGTVLGGAVRRTKRIGFDATIAIASCIWLAMDLVESPVLRGVVLRCKSDKVVSDTTRSYKPLRIQHFGPTPQEVRFAKESNVLIPKRFESKRSHQLSRLMVSADTRPRLICPVAALPQSLRVQGKPRTCFDSDALSQVPWNPNSSSDNHFPSSCYSRGAELFQLF